MYGKGNYPKGVWTDRSYTSHKIATMPLEYLWNVVYQITEGLFTQRGSARRFWLDKRQEILHEIDRRMLRGQMLFLHVPPQKTIEILTERGIL